MAYRSGSGDPPLEYNRSISDQEATREYVDDLVELDHDVIKAKAIYKYITGKDYE